MVNKAVKNQHLQAVGNLKGQLLKWVVMPGQVDLISRQEAERRKSTAIVETITIPKQTK